MSELHPHRPDELFYVASDTAPPSRRPPAMTIGAAGWLRKNLFSNAGNVFMTVVTVTGLIWFLYEFITWSIGRANWDVVNNTTRLLMVGLYPIEELWRIELIAVMLTALIGLGMGIWGGNARTFFLVGLAILVAAIILPMFTKQLAPPPYRFLVSPTGQIDPIFFVADSGNEITVAVEPIDDNAIAQETIPFVGFIENSAGLNSSRSLWNSAKAQVVAGTLDLSDYNLQFSVQLLNSRGQVVAEALSTPAQRSVTFSDVTGKGWYAVRVLRDEEGLAIVETIDGVELPVVAARELPNTGFAWVRIDGVNVMSTKTADVERRIKDYGAFPNYQCPSSVECRRQVVEEAVRFEGVRSFSGFLKTQFEPFIKETLMTLFVGFAVLLTGYAVGNLAKQSRNPASGKLVNRVILIGWLLFFPLSWYLLAGMSNSSDLHPYLRLPQVQQSLWGGLILTIVLTFVSLTVAFPIGILLALGRRSNLPIISLFCTIFIEVVRGVPLITILFMAKFIVPYFAKSLSNTELLIRLLVGLTLFTAAYNAEIIRGGLQIIPKGQIEASQALGLNSALTNIFIVLPQALRAVIPAFMSQSVSLFKDTTLVSIVGVYEFLGMIEFIVNGQQVYRPYQREAYLFIGIVYFIISYLMSSLSRRLEESGAGTVRKMRRA